MSPISPSKKILTPTTANQVLTKSQYSVPEHQQYQHFGMQTASRRNSSQSGKQAMLAGSRVNSMASVGRTSRAGSRQSGTVHGEAIYDGNFDLEGFEPDFDVFLGGLSQSPYNLEGTLAGLGATSGSTAIVPTDCINPAMLHSQSLPPIIDPMLLSTPGLTALPGATEFTSQQPGEYQQYQYPDPMVYAQQSLPYYAYYPQPYIPGSYMPHQQPTQLQFQDGQGTSPRSQKRRRSNSDSEDDIPILNKRRQTVQRIQHDSDSDAPIVKSVKPNRRRDRSRESGVSSSSSLGKGSVIPVAQAGQLPQKCDEKPWVRINNNTKGETTRTARINEEANELRNYKYKPLPHGDWESGKYKFEYTSVGGLDEFKKKKMSARQIQEYITQYPSDDLRLWIQVSPADMARRYGSPAHSKCLFENCPKHVWGDSGTIDVGHYRIAFDEKFKRYGNKVVDPFDVPGFVHLYCMERFLDFEGICRVADIEVDSRVALPREASLAKWTMCGRREEALADRFIKTAKSRRIALRSEKDFENYPVHVSSSIPKPFQHTLVHGMVNIAIQSRTRSQMRQFIDRKMTPNIILVNKGDLEVAMTQKKIRATKHFKKAIRSKTATAATYDFRAHYDEFDPIINIRLEEYAALKVQYDLEDARGHTRETSRAVSKKRGRPVTSKRARSTRAVRDDFDSEPDFAADSDDEMLDYKAHQAGGSRGVRSSPRNYQPVNYNEEIIPGFMPAGAQHDHFIGEDHAPAGRHESLSHIFPKSVLGEPTLEMPATPPPQPVEELTQAEIDRVLNLARRRSSTLSKGPHYAGIMKTSKSPPRSPQCPRTPRLRQASFKAQPVTSSKEFGFNDPPSALATSPTEGRRSARLASKATSI
jgi:hypothetical protein